MQPNDLGQYGELLTDVKLRIREAQTRAVLAVNAGLVHLYWDIGRLIAGRQQQEGWGAGVIPRLAQDLHNELPELKGFSERNIKLMVQFAREYPNAFPAVPPIGQPAVAQLPRAEIGQLPVAQIPWAHNVLLMQRVKDESARLWYMHATLENGWSRNTLAAMIDTDGIRGRLLTIDACVSTPSPTTTSTTSTAAATSSSN